MKLLAMLMLTVLFLTGCVNFTGTDQSVWSEGKWLILVLLLIGDIYFWYKTIKSMKSGHTQQTPGGGPTKDSDENVSIWETGWIWAAILCTAATVYTIWSTIADK